ncbi:DUF1993 family protein [Rhizobium jaguaris]|uniref:DUF1993 family protein n=1 Tax=Rhizobium jaguaris TaxID=1312183 RepID=UPI0013C52869|nr:DUF1993 family protein [Rhizobium jaguaris]
MPIESITKRNLQFPPVKAMLLLSQCAQCKTHQGNLDGLPKVRLERELLSALASPVHGGIGHDGGYMSFSIYDITVPVMLHGLVVMDDYLLHAQNLERSNSLDPGSVLTSRLAPDMLTFGEQFVVNCNKVELHMTKLMNRNQAAPPNVAMIYPALQGRLLETRSFLRTIQPEDLANAQSHIYQLAPSVAKDWIGGDDYIRHVVLADFFFHIAVAHAILRHLGAPAGKKDYLGHLTPHGGGDYF